MLGEHSRTAALAGALALSTLGTVPTPAWAQGWTYPGTTYTYSRPLTYPYQPWGAAPPRYVPYAAPGTYSSYYGPPVRSSGARRWFNFGGWNREKNWPTGRGVPLAKPWLHPR